MHDSVINATMGRLPTIEKNTGAGILTPCPEMHKEPALRSIVRTECGTSTLFCDVIKDVRSIHSYNSHITSWHALTLLISSRRILISYEKKIELVQFWYFHINMACILRPVAKFFRSLRKAIRKNKIEPDLTEEYDVSVAKRESGNSDFCIICSYFKTIPKCLRIAVGCFMEPWNLIINQIYKVR